MWKKIFKTNFSFVAVYKIYIQNFPFYFLSNIENGKKNPFSKFCFSIFRKKPYLNFNLKCISKIASKPLLRFSHKNCFNCHFLFWLSFKIPQAVSYALVLDLYSTFVISKPKTYPEKENFQLLIVSYSKNKLCVPDACHWNLLFLITFRTIFIRARKSNCLIYRSYDKVLTLNQLWSVDDWHS